MRIGISIGMGVGGGAPAFDPLTQLVPDAWYRETRTLSGSDVDQWTDLSGNGNHLTPPGNKPTAGATMNGQPTIDFAAASSQRFTAVGKTLADFITAGAQIFWVVLIADAWAANSANTYQNDGLLNDGGGQTWGLHGKSGGGGTVMGYIWDGADKHADVTLATGTAAVIEVVHDTGTLYTRKNLGAYASVASGNAPTGGTFTVGFGGTTYFDGRIAEMLFKKTVVSTTLRDAYVSHLMTRYGI